MQRAAEPATYRKRAQATLASAFGWERPFDVGEVDDNIKGIIDVAVGTPFEGATILYTSGVAWPLYRRGAQSGVELVAASKQGELTAAKLLLGMSATFMVKSIEPRVGAFVKNARTQVGLPDGTARHGFIVPPISWGDAHRDLFIDDFWLRSMQVTLLTDEELDYFQAHGWDDFSDWMAEAHVDVADWSRDV